MGSEMCIRDSHRGSPQFLRVSFDSSSVVVRCFLDYPVSHHEVLFLHSVFDPACQKPGPYEGPNDVRGEAQVRVTCVRSLVSPMSPGSHSCSNAAGSKDRTRPLLSTLWEPISVKASRNTVRNFNRSPWLAREIPSIQYHKVGCFLGPVYHISE